MDFKKLFGLGSSTPPPPPPPVRPPAPPTAKSHAKASGNTPSIVGRWKEPGSADTTEFHSDGSVTEKPASGEKIRGRYVLAGDKLKINLEGVPEELSFTVHLGADALEMTDRDGQRTEYRRA